MGMAASQARLLALTARIHDVEAQAQSIQNAKIQLSTQSDQVYNEYLEAMDASVLTVNVWNAGSNSYNPITANFMNLCSSKALATSDNSRYALKDNRGRLVVEQEIYEAYKNFNGDDAYAFAMYMIDGNAIGNQDKSDTKNNFNKVIQDAEEAAYNEIVGENTKDSLALKHDSIINLLKENAPDGVEVKSIYDGHVLEEASNDVKTQYKEALDSYKYELYRRNSDGVYQFATEGGNNYSAEKDTDWALFNKYAEIYKQIQLTPAGCVSIEAFNGSKIGNAKNNNEWLQAVIQSGTFTIETYSVDSKTGEVTMRGTSPSSDTSLSYTQETTIDKTALAKAEAKYNHDLKEIDKKDKKFDMSLSKLETERTALTTEYDSVKKVIQDNIERTFGIFS